MATLQLISLRDSVENRRSEMINFTIFQSEIEETLRMHELGLELLSCFYKEP